MCKCFSVTPNVALLWKGYMKAVGKILLNNTNIINNNNNNKRHKLYCFMQKVRFCIKYYMKIWEQENCDWMNFISNVHTGAEVHER